MNVFVQNDETIHPLRHKKIENEVFKQKMLHTVPAYPILYVHRFLRIIYEIGAVAINVCGILPNPNLNSVCKRDPGDDETVVWYVPVT